MKPVGNILKLPVYLIIAAIQFFKIMVASKQLISALTGKNDLYMLTGQPGYEKGRYSAPNQGRIK